MVELRFIRHFAICILFLVAQNSYSQYFVADNSYLTIGNDSIELKFQKWDGELYSLVDKAKNIDFIREKNTNWNLYVLKVNINQNTTYLGGWVSNSFSYDTVSRNNSLVLNLHWNGFNNPNAINMPVTVSVEMPKNLATTQWGIEIKNNENYTIENIGFPFFSGLDQISTDADKDFLVYPKWGGLLVKNPVNTLKIDQGLAYDNEYPSASNNMQFMAYYNTEKNSGLYISTNDPEGSRKLFNMNKLAEHNLQMYINHTPIFTTNSTVKIPYKVQIGLVKGSWYDAAVKYKNSIKDFPWLAKGKLTERADVPEWFKGISYHSWIFTHPPEVPTANPFSMVPQISKELHTFLKAPGITDWVGWENTGWYINYPDVFPPKEGWPIFRNTMASLHDSNFHAMSISNCNSYSTTAPTFSAAQSSIVKANDNNYLLPSAYAEGNISASLYTMCPATTFWKNKLSHLMDTLVQESMDVIQVDGFPLTIPICYDASHGHPIGGGNWWYKAYYDLMKTIRDKSKSYNPKTAFSTEAMSEAYIPLFDSYWDPYTTGISPCQLQYANCSNIELIPLWQTVYHEYILTQSGISFYTPPAGEDDYYRRGFGRALVWGEVPTTFTTQTNYNNNPQSKLLAYLKQIVQARNYYAKEFLVYGEMQRQLELAVPQFINNGANSIPYTGANYPAFNSTSVLTSSWKSQQGTAGHIFTNISNSAVAFNCQLPNYGNSGAQVDVIKILNGNFSVLHRNVNLPIDENISLSTNDVLIIKALPATNTYMWAGTVSSDWNNAANWSPAVVPTSNDNVQILSGTPFSPQIANGINGFCKTLQADPNAQVNIAAGGNLKIGL